MDTALVRYKAAQGSISLRNILKININIYIFFLVINTLFHLGIIFD